MVAEEEGTVCGSRESERRAQSVVAEEEGTVCGSRESERRAQEARWAGGNRYQAINGFEAAHRQS